MPLNILHQDYFHIYKTIISFIKKTLYIVMDTY
jgi:hypothetical protein